jgi:initiation factor 1A
MVRNISGGNKTKKQKRNYAKYNPVDKVEQGQMFAQITQNNGAHFMVLCSDNVPRIGKMSGALKKGPRLLSGSFVIISLREFETDQKHCDIIAIADPPSDIKNLFKKNDPNKSRENEIEFVDSDDEFKEFEESKTTTNIVQDNNQNNNGTNEDFEWGDI